VNTYTFQPTAPEGSDGQAVIVIVPVPVIAVVVTTFDGADSPQPPTAVTNTL